eukprot:CAMPEP_0118955898 /NCGR_PEP_ID=MMETSP1169-20130426/60708_1 /TAXON_ID=36882 /ORGANISM="Pyramimonas obovata, Strain CCMP722" /LENGTH=72 /DNA_ID=CAMNT_0006903825 /DNA_START=120 /DNA_END=334 /DNA_ORIENTATION=+
MKINASESTTVNASNTPNPHVHAFLFPPLGGGTEFCSVLSILGVSASSSGTTLGCRCRVTWGSTVGATVGPP